MINFLMIAHYVVNIIFKIIFKKGMHMDFNGFIWLEECHGQLARKICFKQLDVVSTIFCGYLFFIDDNDNSWLW
jgi:hypothetical protein